MSHNVYYVKLRTRIRRYYTSLLLPAGYRVTIDYAEVERLADYRRLFHLRTMQTDLIERLMIERDFYRDNCHRQARFGLMVNGLFG